MHTAPRREITTERIKRWAWIAATAWLCLGASARAQLGEVVGQVTDPAGIPLANVSVQSDAADAVTDPGGIYRLVGVAQESRVVVRFSGEGLATTYGIVDLAPPPGVEDSDGDGIPDAEDACPMSDLRPTVIIRGCDSRTENTLLPSGCTIADLVAECADGAKNHGHFVSCVSKLLKRLVSEKVLTRWEAYRIKRCAVHAKKPKFGKRNTWFKRVLRSWWGRACNPSPAAPAAPAVAVVVPTYATLNKVMVPCGATQLVDAQAGGTVEQDGFRVTFLPDSIDAVGEVELVLCPINVASPELGAFPGDYLAVSQSGGDLVQLETFSLMEISLTQGGQPVNLADGQSAMLEFLLPESTPLVPGDTVGLWSFDTETGLWVEEELGLVGLSSMDPARLSVVGMVSHFSWWNCDQPIETFSCVQGVVRDVEGNPVANAQVVASGVDYNGSSYASTSADGTYCLNVRIDSIVEVTASAFSGLVRTTSIMVATGGSNVTCADGGCVPLDLMLPGASCIEGIVIDVVGAPIGGVVVASTAGTFATSAADGTFCLSAPADVVVSLFATGFFIESVLTPPEGPDCTVGGCAQVVLQEPPVNGGTACIIGEFIPDDFNAAGETLIAIDAATGLPVGTVGVTDEDYTYCIEGVPLNTNVFLVGQGPACRNAISEVFNTGPGAGDCDTPGACVVAPALECFGGPAE